MTQHDNYDKDILKTLKRIASSLEKIEKHLGNKNGVQVFDNETSIGAANRKLVLDFLHKKELSKAAQELDPIVDICPCNECSDDVRMSCKIVCNEYYDWVRRLKGE